MTDWTQEAIERRIQARIATPKSQQPQQQNAFEARPSEVVVTDIHMTFGSMVSFMVKWAIASIPALLILFVLIVVFWISLALLGGVTGGIIREITKH